jgi:hypothetical protein
LAAGAGEDVRLQRRDAAGERVVEQLLVPHFRPGAHRSARMIFASRG